MRPLSVVVATFVWEAIAEVWRFVLVDVVVIILFVLKDFHCNAELLKCVGVCGGDK